jgi:hypothetical protein
MKWIAGFTFLLLLNLFVESRYVFTPSAIITDTEVWNRIASEKTDKIKYLIKRLRDGDSDPWLNAAAPVIWMSKDEKYPPSDPAELFEYSELWYREVNPLLPYLTVTEKRIAPGEDVNAHTPFDVVTRLFERGGIASGTAGFEYRYDRSQKLSRPAPLLWRLSLAPLFAEIQPQAEDEALIAVEFWYHNAYNYTGIFFGNHFGDWESFLILFSVKDKGGAPEIIPVAYNTSAHGGGTWRCKKDLLFENGRLQLFSAVGTHATYPTPGTHFNGIYPDITRRDTPWNTFELMRPLMREPYYGFSGSWGATSFVHWMNGPIPPGPRFKYLPRTVPESARAQWNDFIASCPL